MKDIDFEEAHKLLDNADVNDKRQILLIIGNDYYEVR